MLTQLWMEGVINERHLSEDLGEGRLEDTIKTYLRETG